MAITHPVLAEKVEDEEDEYLQTRPTSVDKDQRHVGLQQTILEPDDTTGKEITAYWSEKL